MAVAGDVEAQAPHESSCEPLPTAEAQAPHGSSCEALPTAESAEPHQDRLKHIYTLGDVESPGQLPEEVEVAKQDQGPGGDYIKAFVFGGLDGIVSTFALVSGLGGAHVAMGQLIAVSLAKVLADGFSMGFGEFTSAVAEMEHAWQMRARELRETENHEEAEAAKLYDIYRQKGCGREDALTMLTVMSKYKDLFVDHMLILEHGVMPPEGDDRWAPVKQGLVCFLAFFCFGMVPLTGFLVLLAVQKSAAAESSEKVLGIAYGLTAATLFSMGVIKAKLTGSNGYFKSGALMVINGTVAGGSAYLIGMALAAWFGEAAAEGM